MSKFIIVKEDKEFRFKELCPYCKGDLIYQCSGWEQDNEGLWMVDSFDMECTSMPAMENQEEWEEWFKQHSDMPYVHQLPVDNLVKEYINKKYRFDIS